VKVTKEREKNLKKKILKPFDKNNVKINFTNVIK